MNLLLDSFWRALAYCLLPRVIALSFLPLVLMVALSAAGVYFFWEGALQGLQAWLSDWSLLDGLMRWLEEVGFKNLRNVVAPLLVLVFALPLVIILSLLMVSWLMTPAIVSLVAERRFPRLAHGQGGTFWHSVWQGLGASLLAAIALLASIPLWLIPPFFLILPPLIWGWLTYRVMGYDVLAEHATHEERQTLIRRHRGWLLAIGVITGYLGAAPGLVFAIGAMAVVMAPLLIPLAIWIYTFVFAFSALWFAHFCLAALDALRAETLAASAPNVPPPLHPPETQVLGINHDPHRDNSITAQRAP